jgi:hypothetical protein
LRQQKLSCLDVKGERKQFSSRFIHNSSYVLDLVSAGWIKPQSALRLSQNRLRLAI